MITPLRQRIAEAIGEGRPVLVVIAGSNGAGKSTFFTEALAQTDLPFINADEIARALAEVGNDAVSGHAYEAMKLADDIRMDLVKRRESFIMETVLSDTQGAKLGFFRQAQASGYVIIFVYITLSDVQLSVARVIHRVENGGHDVPDDKLFARFERTRSNAAKALAMADLGFVFDNSNLESPFRLTALWERGVEHRRLMVDDV
jgi:predicted ABC-type ATPase